MKTVSRIRGLIYTALLGLLATVSLMPASTLTKDQLEFVPNRGQLADGDGNLMPDVAYTAGTGDVRLFFRGNSFSYLYYRTTILPKPEGPDSYLYDYQNQYRFTTYRMDLELVGSNPDVRVSGSEESGSRYHYYLGHCRQGIRDVRPVSTLRYSDVYDNIDLLVYGKKGGIKYEFVLHPGADPNQIRLRYRGADKVALQADGGLRVSNPLGELREEAPFSYQRYEDPQLGKARQRPVVSAFVLDGEEVSFRLGNYNKGQILVIDPGVVFATYFGGQSSDVARDCATDSDANLYVVGETASANLPATIGARQEAIGGQVDAFLAKFDRQGRQLWTTFYGGSKGDAALAVTTDRAKAVVFTGYTLSNTDFPVRNAEQPTMSSSKLDVMIVKFSGNGDLRWATYFGGSNAEQGLGIAADSSNNIALTGWTDALGVDFPLKNEYSNSKNNFPAAFVARINSNGNRLWATYFAGPDFDRGHAVAVDARGDYIVAGRTDKGIPATSGAYQETPQGSADAFIAKFDALGDLEWATHYGGEAGDFGFGMGVDKDRNIYVCGSTSSDGLPLLDAYQPVRVGAPEATAFLAKFSPGGDLSKATYFPSTSTATLNDLAVLSDNTIVFTGETNGDDLAVSGDALQTARSAGSGDRSSAIIGQMDADLSTLLYGSYYGTDSVEIGHAVCGDPNNNFIVVGETTGLDLEVKNAFQDRLFGNRAGFIQKFGCELETVISISGELEFCEGGTVELDAGPGFAEYEWSNGETSQRIVVEESGEFFVTIRDALGCEFTSEPLIVKVWPFPEPVITADGPIVLCDGGSVTLDAGPGFASYRWSTGESTQTITVSEEDIYFLTVSNDGGCETEVSETVLVRKRPEPTSEPLELDFGELDGCKTSDVLDLILRNPEGFPIQIEKIEFSDPAYSFTEPALGSEVPAGESVAIKVLFTPGDDSPDEALMTISGGPCDWSYQVRLRGSKGEFVFSASPLSAAFGTVLLCDPTVRDTVITFSNSGTSEVTVNQPGIGAPFEIIEPSDWPQTVAPDGSLEIRIRYAPASLGSSNIEMRVPFTSGDCDETLRIGFSGAAEDAFLSTVSSVDFGRLTGCEDEAETIIRLVNNFAQPLQLIAVLDPDGNVLADGLPLDINADGSAELTLRFRPGMRGVISGVATLRYSLGPCEKELTLDYAGTKESAAFDVPTTLDFGTLIRCEEDFRVRQISIGSESGGSIKTITIDGPFTTTMNEGASVPGDFDINFVPDTDGDISGSIEIVFEPCDVVRTIAITARAETHALEGPDIVNFPPTSVGTPVTQIITYRNTGSGIVTIQSLDCIQAPFRILSPDPVNDFPFDLAPGADLDVQVEFDASAAGDALSQLCVLDGGPCGLRLETELTAAASNDAGTVTVALPEVSTHPHERALRIPLLLQDITNAAAAGNGAFLAYLRFNATMFFPEGVEPGLISSNTLRDGERLLEITLPSSTLTVGQPLTEIIGAALLGNETSTVLHLDSLVWLDGNVLTTVESGRLTLDELCEAAGTRLLDYDGEFGIALIMPNPSPGEPEILVRELEGQRNTLELYSASGRLVQRIEWQAAAGDSLAAAKERRVVLSGDLPAGIYQLLLKSSVWSDASQLIIVK